MRNLAIIPARGGSKRIPRKNIKDFLGKPIIQYSIEAAINSGLFDEIMVSTEDEEIAEIAIKCGAVVPFFRNAALADDYATIGNVVEEVLKCYRDQQGIVFDYVCCLFATAPLVRVTNISNALDLMLENKFTAVFPVLRFSYPIQRALEIDPGTQNVKLIWQEYLNTRSQDLKDAYHDCGQFYWADVGAFMEEKTFFTSHASILELSPLEAQDIDNEQDWTMAELKYKMLNNL